MDIVNIDAELFEKMLSKFEDFINRMETLCHLHTDKAVGDWLDNQDVSLLLNVSYRTLQTLRDNGTLPFTKINRKAYYRPKDVEEIISHVEKLRISAIKRGKQI